MRVLTLLATLFLSTAIAQSYLPPLDPNEDITITFYNYNLASAGLGAQGTQRLIDEFMEANPNVTVEGVGVSSDQMISRIQADVVAGRAPDVAQIVFDDLDFLANGLGITPLEELVAPEELAAHYEGFNPRGLELGRLDGSTYGLAYTFSTPVLWINEDLFRAAGLDPDAPPTTWAAVQAAAQTIQDATDAYGVYVSVFGQFDWMFQSLVLSNSGRVLSEDRSELTFDTPEAIGAVQMLRDLRDAGLKPDLGFNEALEAFLTGNLAMYVQTSAVQSYLLSASQGVFELGAAKLPAFGDKPVQPTNSGSALFILTDDPMKQRAAWELMKFATSERGYTIITTEIGYLPLRPAIVRDPAYLGDWVAANPIVEPNLAQLENLSPWVPFPGPNYKQMALLMMAAVEEAVFGDAPVADVMLDAHERASALMPR